MTTVPVGTSLHSPVTRETRHWQLQCEGPGPRGDAWHRLYAPDAPSRHEERKLASLSVFAFFLSPKQVSLGDVARSPRRESPMLWLGLQVKGLPLEVCEQEGGDSPSWGCLSSWLPSLVLLPPSPLPPRSTGSLSFSRSLIPAWSSPLPLLGGRRDILPVDHRTVQVGAHRIVGEGHVDSQAPPFLPIPWASKSLTWVPLVK